MPAKAIGPDRVGIRLSPYGAFNDMAPYTEVEPEYEHLAKQLGALRLAYVHLVDHSSQGAPKPAESTIDKIRAGFGGAIILSGGYDRESADRDLAAGRGDLIAFGRPFIANPDLPSRLRTGAPLASPDPSTFYTPGKTGYTDYPSA